MFTDGKPRNPAEGYAGKRLTRAGGKPSPDGNRAERRAFRQLAERRQRQQRPEVDAARSHMWREADGVCVLHNRRCPR